MGMIEPGLLVGYLTHEHGDQREADLGICVSSQHDGLAVLGMIWAVHPRAIFSRPAWSARTVITYLASGVIEVVASPPALPSR